MPKACRPTSNKQEGKIGAWERGLRPSSPMNLFYLVNYLCLCRTAGPAAPVLQQTTVINPVKMVLGKAFTFRG